MFHVGVSSYNDVVHVKYVEVNMMSVRNNIN